MLTLYPRLGLLLLFLLTLGAARRVTAAPDVPGAVIPVTSLRDSVAVNGDCTLREALRAATLNAPYDACAAGGSGPQPDRIVFAVDGTIKMTGRLGEFVTSENLIVEGNGRDKTIVDAQGQSRVFRVTGGPAFTLRSLTLQNGYTDATAPGVDGGALHSRSQTLFLTDVAVLNSRAAGPLAEGGALYAENAVLIADSLIAGNSAEAGAGGVVTLNANVEITNSTIRDNHADGSDSNGAGGLAFFDSEVMVVDSLIADNSADGSRFGGGGIGIVDQGSGRPVTISGTTVSGNSAATASGGGIYHDGGTLTITNSTISGNAAQTGGGFYLASPAAIRFATITANSHESPGYGSAVDTDLDSAITITRSIVAANVGPVTCFHNGNILSAGYNLWQDGSCGFPAGSDLVGTDPRLGPLQNNGGPTLTHALAADSPAVDAGACMPGVQLDQRGFRRSSGLTCDMGAFEYDAGGYRLSLPAVLAP